MKYSDYINNVHFKHKSISYNLLTKNNSENKKIKVTGKQAFNLIKPYCTSRIYEQMKAVIPLALYLVLFQFFVLQYPVQDFLALLGGLIAVILGLAVFMEGLSTGLMPFGTIIGDNLPKKASMIVVLIIIGILGVGVDVNKAPYLYEILNNWTLPLVLMVGAGVGIAAIIGTIRFVKGWSLKPLIYITIAPVIVLTIFAWFDPNLRSILGLAWDCGAVTTGPVTVPLVLSLGIGIANAAGKGDSSLSGFGVVTMASLFPIMAVLILALFVSFSISPEQIIESAKSVSAVVVTDQSIFDQTPFVEIILGVRAILPLVIFLMFVLFIVLRSSLPNRLITIYGLVLSIIGMCIFNVGLTYGLGAIGTQTGSILPAAFMNIPISDVSPIYSEIVGFVIVIVFAFLLGFGATLAEPALNALGITVQNLTTLS